MRPSGHPMWAGGHWMWASVGRSHLNDEHDDEHHDEYDVEHDKHDDKQHDDDDIGGRRMTLHTGLMGIGFLAFVLAAAEAPIPRVNLVALGLALVTLGQLL